MWGAGRVCVGVGWGWGRGAWGACACLGRVRGAVAVDAQLGRDGREMKLIQWPLDAFWPLDVE